MKRTNKISILFLFLLLYSSFCYGQSKVLLGSWEMQIDSLKEKSSESIIGAKTDLKVLKLTFYKNGTGYDNLSDLKFEYSLSDEKLIIGQRIYDLLELTQSKLVLQEPETLLSLEPVKLIFLKIEN